MEFKKLYIYQNKKQAQKFEIKLEEKNWEKALYQSYTYVLKIMVYLGLKNTDKTE